MTMQAVRTTWRALECHPGGRVLRRRIIRVVTGIVCRAVDLAQWWREQKLICWIRWRDLRSGWRELVIAAAGAGVLGLLRGCAARIGSLALRTGFRVLHKYHPPGALAAIQWWREQKLAWWVRRRDLQIGWREQKLAWWIRWRDLQIGWRERTQAARNRLLTWPRKCRAFCESGYIDHVMRLLNRHAALLRPVLRLTRGKRVLYVGQSYYHSWYLSRELRRHGWKADLLDWDQNPSSQLYYHGADFRIEGGDAAAIRSHFAFYLKSILRYDVFHFANAHGMIFGYPLHRRMQSTGRPYDEVRLLRRLGKKIVYSHSGCLDGVSQTSFRSWAQPSTCDICKWRDMPAICSDERNLEWGRTRNELADIQCTIGGNRKDYNDDPRVCEVPEFFCLNPKIWDPAAEIPERLRLPEAAGTVRLYHAVGNFFERTDPERVNIKSTHIYLPLIEQLKGEGYDIDLLFYTNVPNMDLRFYQMQADIFLDMLSYGWFGANAREAMMLGKPVICYLRPAWLASMREQIPEYVDELPIVSATPDNVRDVLVDLVENPDKRREIGRRSRDFALKWHSPAAGAKRLGRIYEALLAR